MNNTPHLEIDAHVLHQLGDELITDSEQALLELVKNSYDADSGWCNLIIDTQTVFQDPVENSSFHGCISVEDNGCGMSIEDIRRGWLTVSISPKREMKLKGFVTPKYKRTPVGDKGLGRLGTMRLGEKLEIQTFHSPEQVGYKVVINWSDCKSGIPLSAVPIRIEELQPTGATGTKLKVYGLNNPSYWIGENQRKQFEMKLSTFLSPFRSFDNFTVAFKMNNVVIDLVSFPELFLDTALAKFDFVWDNGVLSLSGAIKHNLCRGHDTEHFYQHHVIPDHGQKLQNYLLTHKRLSRFQPKKSKAKKWLIEVESTSDWQDSSGDVLLQTKRTNPGPFMGEIYMFPLRSRGTDYQTIARTAREYSKHIKTLSGIHVYRNNFKIRLGSDWLELGKQWATGENWYSLRPNNTIGFVAITSRDNPFLVEKSDREGFVENEAFAGLWDLMKKTRDFANNVLGDTRRAYNDYRSATMKKEARLPEQATGEQSAEEISKLMKVSSDITTKLKKSIHDRNSTLTFARAEIKKTLSEPNLSEKNKQNLQNVLVDIDRIAFKAHEEDEAVRTMFDEFANKAGYIDVIKDRFKQLENQISEVYETVGVGLVAQALAHEVYPAVHDISNIVRKITSEIRNNKINESQLTQDLELIRSLSIMIGKKLAFLDPMVRAFRENRHVIGMNKFAMDFLSLRSDRHLKFRIHSSIQLGEGGDFRVRMNRGRLSQVLDNLTRNSEYWLRSQAIQAPTSVLELNIVIDSPLVKISDTGPGIRKGMEDVCFEIFTTDKPGNTGHGLGLFIAHQLLEEQGCSICLSEKRNTNGRKYEFVIDFSSVIME